MTAQVILDMENNSDQSRKDLIERIKLCEERRIDRGGPTCLNN